MATTSNENLISNLSYTDKDFQVIYPALLDLVKKETAKWDPSASNESDPGVLLLKLNAIIADKCNYNIDKNVLECFPLSVTQDTNARQLFEQLGYYMHWYNAATTYITMKYIGDTPTDDDGNEITETYTIPMFTMLSNDDGSIVYTTTESKDLSTSGQLISMFALQGVKVDYEINDSTTITTANLDLNNRLYFDETNIAENGIFICNIDSENYSSWEKKDNLLIEELSGSNYFYKFGVEQDSGTCYIEFPENAEELFQSGINITYIKTNGVEGNLSAGKINSFYNDLIIDDNTTLTTSTVKINNYVASVGGANPETIDEAYTGYKKVVGTFDTLITLRDYLNAVRNSEYISNGIICDRTSDVQSSYKIISQAGSVNQSINEIELDDSYDVVGYLSNNEFYKTKTDAGTYEDKVEPNEKLNYYNINTTSSGEVDNKNYKVLYIDGEHQYIQADKTKRLAMEAFDLKMYILTANSILDTATDYKSTFTLNMDESVQAIVEAEIDEYKCVQHDFKDLLTNKICFLKNKYPIDCKIIPQYSLTSAQKDEVTEAIKKALFASLNASQISFGQELIYEDVYNTILNADSRIKAVALDPLEYTTYAVYIEQSDDFTKTLKEVDISEFDFYNKSTSYFNRELISADLGDFEDCSVSVMDKQGNVLGTTTGIGLNIEDDIFNFELLNYKLSGATEIFLERMPIYKSTTGWIDSPATSKDSTWQRIRYNFDLSEVSTALVNWIDANTNIYIDAGIGLSNTIVNKFRKEIYAKSVLAGKTQFFIKDTKFDYGINQKYQILEDEIGRIDTNLNVSYTLDNDWIYSLRDNEIVQLFSPNLIEQNEFANNVRFEYYIYSGTIPSNTTYSLKSGEFIIFYYTEDSETNESYSYKVFGEGTIIRASFALNNSVSSVTDLVGNELTTSEHIISVTVNNQTYKYATGTTISDNVSATLHNKVKRMTDSNNLLSGEKSIYTLLQNSVSITPELHQCYWILNEATNGKFILFDDTIGNERILQSGEYFIYINTSSAEMSILGSGTFITRPQGEEGQVISCVAGASYQDIVNSAESIAENLVTVPVTLAVTEMQYIELSDGVMSRISPNLSKTLELGTFDQNIRYEYYLNGGKKIPANINYKLVSGDYIIFYKEVMDEEGTTLDHYEYHICGQGTLISSTFSLTNPSSTLVGNVLKDKCIAHEEINGTTTLTYYYGTGSTKDFSGLTESVTSKLSDSSHIIDDAEEIIALVSRKIPTQLLLNSADSTTLNGYKIQYRTNVNDTWTTVGGMDLNSDVYGWKAKAILKLTVSASEPQMLQDNQSITYYKYDSSNKWIITNTDEMHDYYISIGYTEDEWDAIKPHAIAPGAVTESEEGFEVPTYLLTSTSFDTLGPSVSTLEYDSDDEAQPISIYAYVLGDMDDDISFKNGDTIIKFIDSTKTKQSKSLTFRLPAGDYIMPLSFAVDDGIMKKLQVSMKTSSSETYTVLKTMGSDQSYVTEAGSYYFNLSGLPDCSSSSSRTFFITLKFDLEYIDGKQSTAITVYVPQIFKYTNAAINTLDSATDAELFVEIYELIKELDFNNRFNYTYVVDEDEEIANPLDSLSFLDSNHVMNPYTICQMDTGSDNFNIQITNVVRSS